ncbi:YidH family protein [Nocardia cyriacigeorgica]|uniref:YidH family protein n=1 Tax=Nocardia cyriacigeorgica TaxID=135487 RepID=UPI0002E1A1A3|nr:DUF202 domain-containing protein [Nocardia cyriacigeorgica]
MSALNSHIVEPASGMASGPDVDYRFTLAAERTFLAWIRTALALLAGGVAVHELVHDFATPTVRAVMATACATSAGLVAAAAYPRWRRIDAAMRRNNPLPHSISLVILAGIITAICVVAAVAMVAA